MHPSLRQGGFNSDIWSLVSVWQQQRALSLEYILLKKTVESPLRLRTRVRGVAVLPLDGSNISRCLWGEGGRKPAPLGQLLERFPTKSFG